MPLIIDAEFASLFPPHTPAQIELLTESILAEGCRDPIKVWGKIVVDGMTRFRICSDHAIPYKIEYLEFADRQAAMEWMIRWQIGRRQLTKTQSKYAWGKVMAGKPEPRGGFNLEAASGLSTSTLTRAKRFAEHMDKLEPDVRVSILEHGATEGEVEKLIWVGPEQQQEFIKQKKAKKVASKQREKTRFHSKPKTSGLALSAALQKVADEAFFDDAVKQLDHILAEARRVGNTTAGAYIKLDLVIPYLESARDHLDAQRFHAVCPKCNGTAKGKGGVCGYCRSGWITKWRADEINEYETYD